MIHATPLLAALAFLLSGCAYMTRPMENPVQHDYVGGIFGDRKTAVFSLTPERRTVLVVRKVNGTDSSIMVCAEPPPDASQNIASSLRSLVDASGKDAIGNSASATAELSKGLNTSVASMFYRSQGVQVFRDGLFSLCQAYMNGLISSDDGHEFWERYKALLDVSFALIAQETSTAQAIRGVELNDHMNTKSAMDAALQGAKNAQAAAELAAETAKQALKTMTVK